LTIQRLIVLSLLPTILLDASILRLLVLCGLGLGLLAAAKNAAGILGGPSDDGP
jgi:hypothetical protein